MKSNLTVCPKCEAELRITKYTCPSCFTEITGEFFHDKFSRLEESDLEFIEIFMRNRGSIKDIEKELGVSYPTVRGRLDKAIKALGYNATAMTRIEILQKLDNLEISSEEALELLNEL